APVVLRIGRERKHRPCHFLRHSTLEQSLVRLESPQRICLNFGARCLSRLVVNRLEAVGARFAHLSPHEVGNVKLRLHLRVATRPLVVGMASAVAMVLAYDEQWRLDEESEVAMFKGTAVALPHQKADQPLVSLAHFL